MMARIILGVRLTDPMSGFFAIRKEAFIQIRPLLHPRGFKVMLEMAYLLSLMPSSSIQDVGITFALRKAGKSKLSGGIILSYLKMLFDCRRKRNMFRKMLQQASR